MHLKLHYQLYIQYKQTNKKKKRQSIHSSQINYSIKNKPEKISPKIQNKIKRIQTTNQKNRKIKTIFGANRKKTKNNSIS